MSKGMLAALLLSIVLAISLSLLPERALERWGGGAVSGVESKKDVPVMQMDGVVDELGTLALSSHLQKVIWQQNKLVVWLAVPVAILGGGLRTAHDFVLRVFGSQILYHYSTVLVVTLAAIVSSTVAIRTVRRERATALGGASSDCVAIPT